LWLALPLVMGSVACAFDVSGVPGGDGSGGDEGGDEGQDTPAEETPECAVAKSDPMCIFGESTHDMDLGVQLRIAEPKRIDSAEDLSRLGRKQIVAGFEHDGIDINTVADALKAVDPETGIERSTITYLPTGQRFTMFRMMRDGVEVRYVFKERALKIEATVHDDAVSDCTLALPAELDPRCAPTAERCDLVAGDVQFCVEFEGHAEGCLDLVNFDEMVSCCEQIDRELLFCDQVLDP
jgi:hypothetical protein